jgi:aminoglycoside/choline kinase family phosphotransferase
MPDPKETAAAAGLMHESLVRLFVAQFGHPPRSVLEIAGDGSNRVYFRLIGPNMETAVGAYGPDAEENRAFFSYTRSFHSAGIPVPELYGIDAANRVWLLEDLGDTTLFTALLDARRKDPTPFPAAMLPVYKRVIEMLPRIQTVGAQVIDFNDAYPRAAFDHSVQ